VPVSFGIALFLTELSPKWLKRPLGIAIEFAGGGAVDRLWHVGPAGLRAAAGCVRAAATASGVRQRARVGHAVHGPPVGIGILSAGIILAIMIIPFIAATMRDVFDVTPPMLKESAYGLGSTTWEVVSRVVLPYTKTGVVGGIMLGLGRALGETMRSPSSSATPTSSIRCRCSRPPTASPRPWPTNSPRRAKGCIKRR